MNAQRGAAAIRVGLVGLGVLALVWPALWNGFPLIFSDSGTYISQAMELHLGWDRPPFYSMMLLATDWGVSLWPPVLGQALLALWLIVRCGRIVLPQAGMGALMALTALLAGTTALPFVVGEIMPDIFSPLMVLALFVLVAGAGQRRERFMLIALIAGAIALHDTNLPIYAGLCLVVLLPLSIARLVAVPWRAVLVSGLLGLAALVSVSAVSAGRLALSPYGGNFLLARLIADGPARVTLARDCGRMRWALCAYQGALPRSSDRFLWAPDSPFYRAGGPVRMIGQTNQIVAVTLAQQPWVVARDAARDVARQLVMYRAGTGLRPWRRTAGATIRRDFSGPTVAAFRSSLQALGELSIPGWLLALQNGVAVMGMGVTALLLGLVAMGWRVDRRLALLAALVGASLLGNAVLTGALSGPHDRYQARMVWLAVMVAGLSALAAYSERRSAPARNTT